MGTQYTERTKIYWATAPALALFLISANAHALVGASCAKSTTQISCMFNGGTWVNSACKCGTNPNSPSPDQQPQAQPQTQPAAALGTTAPVVSGAVQQQTAPQGAISQSSAVTLTTQNTTTGIHPDHGKRDCHGDRRPCGTLHRFRYGISNE